MHRLSIVLMLLGALASIAALWLLSGDGSAPPPQPPVESAVRSAGERVGADDVDVSAVSVEAVDASFSALAPDEPERLEAELELEVAPRLVLQVWDRKRGTAAAEADVFVLEDDEAPDAQDPFRPHLCEVTMARGRRYKATTEGQVELPRLSGRTFVAASLGGAVGFRILNERHRGREDLTLQADEAVTVRVVDGAGQPVAYAPVGIQQRVVDRVDAERAYREFGQMRQRIAELQAQMEADPTRVESLRGRLGWYERRLAEVRRTVGRLKRASAGQAAAQKAKVAGKNKQTKASVRRSKVAKPTADVFETRYEVKARRRTDERGYAVFRHFQLVRHDQEKWWPDEHRDRFEAVLVAPLAEPVKAPFTGRPLPEEPVQLVMPPTGSVALRTVDRDGRPFTHPVRGSLRIDVRGSPTWARVQLRKEQDETEIVFDHVGVGVQLIADCRLDDQDFRWRSPTFAGPQVPGERRTVDLVVAPDAAMLYGRVLDDAGEAMASRELTFLINSKRGRLEGEEVVLDREGRFHLPYAPRDASVAPFRFQIRDEAHLEVPGFACTLPLLAAEGVTDLGDLQLGQLDQVAFGRVVDDLGEPVAGAHVQLQRERPRGRDGASMRFEDEAFTDTHSDERGDFWLYGDVEAANYRLRVRADGYFPEETFGINRVTATEIRMMRKARLVGTVRLPEWLSSKRVKVQLRSLDQPGRNRDDQIRDYRGKQYIYFDWVRPGLYSLSLRIEEFPEPFLRIDSLVVRPGDHDPHPRLTDLDLSSYLYRFEVSAVDGNGARISPKRPLLATITRMDGTSELIGFSWKSGLVEIVNSQPTLAVTALAQGYRAEPGVLSAGRSEVQFLRVPPVVLHAPGIRAVIGDTNAWMGLQLLEMPNVTTLDGRSQRGRGQAARRATSSYARLRGDERASLEPLVDGRYRCVAYLGDKAAGGLVELQMGEVDVAVAPGEPPVTVEVQASPQALRTAMDEVLRRQASAPAGAGGK